MPNIAGFKPLANQDWITLQFDDGSESHAINDPTGTYRAEVDSIVQKLTPMPAPDPMAGAVAGPGGGEPEPAPVAPPPLMPPPVSPAGAKAWGSAQGQPAAPAPEQTSPTGAPVTPRSAVIPAGAPSRLVHAGQQRQTSGIASEDAARVEAAQGEAEDAGREANDQDFANKATQYWMEFGRLREDEKGKLAQQSVLQEKQARFDQRVTAQIKRLEDVQSRPIDPSQAFAGDAGWYAFMAAFGDSVQNFGAAIAGRGPVADPGERINQMIERSVRLQTAQKQADFEAGKITAAQLEAEREEVRSNLATVGKQLAETQLSLRQTEQAYAGLGAIRSHFDAMAADGRAKSAQALARTETLQDTFAAPKPATGTGLPRGPVEEELRRRGISKEDYTKALTAKVGQAGENAPTVSSTAQFIKTLDGDIAAMKALMKDGVMPNKVASNQITDTVRAGLQRLGIPLQSDGSADLAEFNQRYTRRIITEAKKMGGVITENDLKFTERVAGQSPQAIYSWLSRMRSDANGELVGTLGAHFPDYTQDVANIMLQGQSSTIGVAGLDTAESFEVTNGEPAAEDAPRELSDVEKRQEVNRKELGRKVSDVVPRFTPPRAGPRF